MCQEGVCNSERDFAAGGEGGHGVECMFVILVIGTHSLEHLSSLCVCRLKSHIGEGGRE